MSRSVRASKYRHAFGYPRRHPSHPCHTAPILDTNWSPFHDSVVASAGEDGKALIWKVNINRFSGWGAEGWELEDFDPVLRIDVTLRCVGQVVWHPTANHVLATPEDAKSVLSGHEDAIQSLAFNPTGTLLVTTSRDRKVGLFDPRTSGEAVRIAEGHSGVKGARHGRIAMTGFSKMSDRQVSLWERGSLNNIKTTTIDQSLGVLMPFCSDNNILFFGSDGNVRYYEYEHDVLHPIAEHKSTDPQRGMCFLPHGRALSVSDCEIVRAYKTCGSTVEPITFIVPRKSDSFQTGEFFSGKNAPPKLVSLEDGAVFAGQAPTAVPSASASSLPTPTCTSTAPAPTPPPAPVLSTPTLDPVSPKVAEPTASPVCLAVYFHCIRDNEVGVLRNKNTKLSGELREAREKKRNLELAVETLNCTDTNIFSTSTR
ncbi:WD40-repeat-containing domain protein [Irpex rosettiformis]|uniref:WD40-repeat-containing domain protein n=1 Tax=Irpex rosettiformis TaxID=378272 RepID=A0ACB8TTM4_9APHY|nr:WD40-repeat-containing domain protein [Irpex rosettiformis]